MCLSIVTTVLNNEKYIRDCVDSVKRQKFKNKYEHIRSLYSISRYKNY